MIIGHLGIGLLTQYFALRQRNSNPKVHPSIPAWCTLVGATLSDVIAGTFVLLGLEHVRSNPSIKPLGLSLVNIDWSHSMFMTIASGAVWATFCRYNRFFSMCVVKMIKTNWRLHLRFRRSIIVGRRFALLLTKLLMIIETLYYT